MPSKFILKQDLNNEFSFQFLDANNEQVLYSSRYPEENSATTAIKDVKLNSLMSQQLAGGRTEDSEMFFVIKSSDGHILVKSALYTSQMKMDNACVTEVEYLTASSAV